MSNSLWPHGLQPCQAPLSVQCHRQEYWFQLPFSSPEHLPHPGLESSSPALAGTLYCGATREDRRYMQRYIYLWAAESDTTEQLGNKFSLQNVTSLPTSTSTNSVSILPWIILITLAVNSFNRYTTATALTLFPTASLHYVLHSP